MAIVLKGSRDVQKIPMSCLPMSVQPFFKDVLLSLNNPEEFIIPTFLSLGATLIGSSASVVIKNSWKVYPNYYMVIVGEPSVKKTPTLNLILSPIDKLNNKLHWEFVKLNNEYKSVEKEKKEKKKSNSVEEIETNEELVQPNENTLFVTDTTQEALVDLLNKNKFGVLIKKDELMHFFNQLNAYKSGGGDQEFYLEVYGQSTISISRRSRENISYVKNPLLNIIGGIQLAPLKEFLKGKENGLVERFSFALAPKDFKSKFSNHEINQENKKIYENLCYKIFEKSFEMVQNKQHQELRLSKEALELWVEWGDNLDNHDFYLDHSAMFEKAKDKAIKTALILHIFKHPDRKNSTIDDYTMNDALIITNYFIDSHIKLMYILEHKEEEDLIEYTIKRLKRIYEVRKPNILVQVPRLNNRLGVTPRDFLNACKSKFKNVDEVKSVFLELVNMGLGSYEMKTTKCPNPNIFFLKEYIIDYNK